MKKKLRKRSGRPPMEEITYGIEIIDWELDYSFSVDKDQRVTGGPYWEHKSFKINGKLIHPDKLSGENIEVTILGDRSLIPLVQEPEKYHQVAPKSVGSLRIRGKQRDFLGWIPFDVFNNIIFLLQTDNIKFIILNGPPLYRGSSGIRSLRFSNDFTKEDWS